MSNSFPTRVYHLGQFPEPVKGVAMAKTSRSPNTFLEDARSMTEEGADKFHERIVVGYGHESVADMSVSSPVFEDLSILASEFLLDLQTGKFQGKSSRYVIYDRKNVTNPFEHGSEAHTALQWAITNLFGAYEGLYPLAHAHAERMLQEDPEFQKLKDSQKPAVIKARALDALRGLLPLAARTNFGSRLSGRDVSQLVRQLLSNPLAEVRDLGEKLRTTAMEELSPTLVRHAEAHPLFDAFRSLELPVIEKPVPTGPHVSLDMQWFYATQEVIRHFILERTGVMPTVGQVNAYIPRFMDELDQVMAQRTRRQDPVPHAFRAVRYRFEIVADFGVWKDLRRHRRCEIFRGPFTAGLGYEVTDDVKDLGDEAVERYCKALETAADVYRTLVEMGYPNEAQYAVAQAHNQHWVMDMDLEQVYYLTELRTAPGGHIAYRRIAYKMYELAKQRDPGLFKHILVHRPDEIRVHH